MKRAKYLGSLLVGMLMVAALILGCGPKPAPSPAPVPKPAPTPAPVPTPAKAIRLSMVGMSPLDSVIGRKALCYMNRVNMLAKGELIIEWKGATEVIPIMEQAAAVKSGVIDMVSTAATFFAADWKGFNYDTVSQYTPLEDRKIGAYDYWVKKYQEKSSVRYLGKACGMGPQALWTNKRVEKIEDLAGQKVRTIGLYVPFAKALGMVPVTIPQGEMYTAMERGLVDAIMFSAMAGMGTDMHIYEVCKYKIHPEFYRDNMSIWVNMNKWNTIPKHLQDLMLNVAEEDEFWYYYIAQLDRDVDELTCVAGGMKIIEFKGAEAKRFLTLASESMYNDMKETLSPEEYRELRGLLEKK